MARFAVVLVVLAWLAAVSASAEGPSVSHDPDAVRITFTLDDLNRILQDLSVSDGWTSVEGAKHSVSNGLHDLSYTAQLSVPRLMLGRGGHLGLAFDILEAELNLGSFERRVARMRTRCENLGVSVEPDRPIHVSVDLNLSLVDGELRLVPSAAELEDARKRFRLVKPSRCRNALLPKTVLWWLGRPYLRRQIERLDERLLDQVRRLTEDLDRRGELLAEQWSVRGSDLYLRPSSIGSSETALSIGFDLSTSDERAPDLRAEERVPALPERSQVALSEASLNALAQVSLADLPDGSREAGKTMTRILKSSAIYALIPGLRALDTANGLRFRVRLEEPPRLVFNEPAAAGRLPVAPVELRLKGLDIDLLLARDTEELLGTLTVDRARVGVAPVVGALGGLSFELIDNSWSVSASGIEQDTELIAATLQEIVFGEIFETRYHPLFRKGVTILSSRFVPSVVEMVGGRLVIGLEHGSRR